MPSNTSRIGTSAPPGLKYFRCVCAVRRQSAWIVLPALDHPVRLQDTSPAGETPLSGNDGDLASLLIYREPWSPAWRVADNLHVDPHGVLSHSIAWVGFSAGPSWPRIRSPNHRGYSRFPSSCWSSHNLGKLARFPSQRVLLPAARLVLRVLRNLHY